MSPFDLLLEHFGTQAEMARAFGVKPMTVWQWKCRRRIPVEYVVRAELLTDGAITKEQLRPDVFAAPKPKTKHRAAVG